MSKYSFFIHLILLSVQFAWPASAHGGGVGYGAAATGGLGLPTFRVTTLSDAAADGACDKHCTLRDALDSCNAAGGGNISFLGLSGNLNLATGGGNLIWTCSNSTIDGSTAAGQGVQILGGPHATDSNGFILDADNVIVRYMRFRCSHYSGRPSAPACFGGQRDIFAITGGRNILIDHNSFEWGTDSLADIGDGGRAATDITYSNNIFAEELGSGAILIGSGATRISFYRNAFISNGARQPDVSPQTVEFGIDAVTVEFVENYWYNFVTAVQLQAGDPRIVVRAVSLGNVWQTGPYPVDTNERMPVLYRTGNQGRVWTYSARNLLLDGGFKWTEFGAAGRSCDPEAAEATWSTACSLSTPASGKCGEVEDAPCGMRMPARPTTVAQRSVSPRLVKDHVLLSAGASLPCRDALDRKVIADAASNGLLGPIHPMTRPSGRLPDLTAPCAVPF